MSCATGTLRNSRTKRALPPSWTSSTTSRSFTFRPRGMIRPFSVPRQCSLAYIHLDRTTTSSSQARSTTPFHQSTDSISLHGLKRWDWRPCHSKLQSSQFRWMGGRTTTCSLSMTTTVQSASNREKQRKAKSMPSSRKRYLSTNYRTTSIRTSSRTGTASATTLPGPILRALSFKIACKREPLQLARLAARSRHSSIILLRMDSMAYPLKIWEHTLRTRLRNGFKSSRLKLDKSLWIKKTNARQA